MKTRISFVANSSSSSFIIQKSILTPEQIERIKNYYAIAKEICDARDLWIARYGGEEVKKENLKHSGCIEHPYFDFLDNSWDITETDTEIKGECTMNNFDFEAYLQFLGVDMDNVNFVSD